MLFGIYLHNIAKIYLKLFIIFFRYKTVINQRKVGRTILPKTKTNIGNILNEKERSQSDVTASVSADHDYNGQNSETDGNINKIYTLS